MKSILVLFIVPALLISILTFPALAADKPPEKGEEMPVINLPVPMDPEERNYLGLSGSGFFKIPQIKAKAVIIEFFSMYCPICQKDAPGVNDLYRLIEKNPDIKNKVKLIGIGAGNSPYEVGVYKKTYDVPFPLFPAKVLVPLGSFLVCLRYLIDIKNGIKALAQKESPIARP